MAAELNDLDLECPVCHEDFLDPKILPCTHLVCQKCVVAWLRAEGPRAGCPLCRARVFSSTATGDLEALVDALPTDLAIQSVVQSQKLLSSPDVCSVCDGANVAASTYCLQCSIKLCAVCSKGHTKIPFCKTHVVEDLEALTVQRLAEVCRMMCKTHADRPVELYCSSHQELICLLCFPTSHRSCAEVKAIADVAHQKRAELKNRAARLFEEEAMLCSQIQATRDEFKSIRKTVSDAFDDLEHFLRERRKAVINAVQVEEDASMTSLSEMEKDRASLKAHAGTVKNLAESAASDALLGMMGKLTSRLQDLERTVGGAGEKKTPLVDVVFEVQDVTRLKNSISAFGQIKRRKNKSASYAANTSAPAETTLRSSSAATTTPTQQVEMAFNRGDRVKQVLWMSDGRGPGTVACTNFFGDQIGVRWDNTGWTSWHDLHELEQL